MYPLHHPGVVSSIKKLGYGRLSWLESQPGFAYPSLAGSHVLLRSLCLLVKDPTNESWNSHLCCVIIMKSEVLIGEISILLRSHSAWSIGRCHVCNRRFLALFFRVFLEVQPYLVGGLEHEFYFSIQLGISSSQLTFIFFRGVGIPPTSYSCHSKSFDQNHKFYWLNPLDFARPSMHRSEKRWSGCGKAPWRPKNGWGFTPHLPFKHADLWWKAYKIVWNWDLPNPKLRSFTDWPWYGVLWPYIPKHVVGDPPEPLKYNVILCIQHRNKTRTATNIAVRSVHHSENSGFVWNRQMVCHDVCPFQIAFFFWYPAIQFWTAAPLQLTLLFAGFGCFNGLVPALIGWFFGSANSGIVKLMSAPNNKGPPKVSAYFSLGELGSTVSWPRNISMQCLPQFNLGYPVVNLAIENAEFP